MSDNENEELNPFRPPQAADSRPIQATTASTDRVPRYRRWIFVFMVNMILPVSNIYASLGERGQLGIAAGVLLAFVISCPIYRSRDFGRSLMAGAILVGVSQFLPILHLLVTVGVLISIEPLETLSTAVEFHAFLSTTMVVLVLLLISLALGHLMRAVSGPSYWTTEAPYRRRRRTINVGRSKERPESGLGGIKSSPDDD